MNSCVCDNCTGCGACAYKCPKSAIKFVLNDRMEYVATIDELSCIHCNLCKRTCPQIQNVALQSPKEVYAAWTKNRDDYYSTSSGGIGTVLSKKILSEKGAVYGALFVSNGRVEHSRIDNIEGLENLKGSKYVQSDFRGIFKQIDDDIKNKRKILVVGTPCQIASIRNCFKTESLENVYLVDLICHGTPPNIFFSNYLNEICPGVENATVSFRKKGYKLTVNDGSSEVFCKKYQIDPYFRSFMYGLIFRENCYTCRYSDRKRVGDVSIGDYWGLNRNKTDKKFPVFVSCVFVNNEKGKLLFESVKDECEFESRSVDEAVRGNANLHHTSQRHKDRNLFLKRVQDGCGFIEAVKSTSIYRDIIICKCMDLIKAPYRRIKYGKWRV